MTRTRHCVDWLSSLTKQAWRSARIVRSGCGWAVFVTAVFTEAQGGLANGDDNNIMKLTGAMKELTRRVLPTMAWLPSAAMVLGSLAGNAATYPQTILADNPVAYYRLEEAAGESTAVDSSSSGANPGTYYSTDGIYPKMEQPGIDVNSVYFRSYTEEGGSLQQSYVEIPYAEALNPAGAFTAECWVRAMSAGTESEYRSPFGSFEGWGASGYPGWFFYQSPDAAGNPSGWLFIMKGGGVWLGGTAVNKAKWDHLVAVYDGTKATFYVNGVVAGAVNVVDYQPTTTKSAFIGAMPTGGYLFDGNVDEVAIYASALTVEQITNHYQVGLANFRAAEIAPEVTRNPAATTAFAGREASFSVGADGTLPFTYQWYKGNTPIADATNEVYKFICQEADNGATFKVKVTNPFGSATSDEATLTVATDLTVTGQPASISRTEGSTVAFRVVAGGALPISYQWYNGATAISGATNDTLWLAGIKTTDDASTYHAKVSNPWTSTDSDEATLTVVARAVTVPLTSSYAKMVAADGPVAYWRLNEADGSTVAVDAVGSFDGAYEAGDGTFTYGVATGVPGETDKGMAVKAKARVVVPNALELNPQGPFAAEAWVKPASLGANGEDYRTVFSSMGQEAGPTGWLLYQQPDHTFAWVIFGNSWSITKWLYDTTHTVEADKWYHIVLQSDGSVFEMYVNGELVASVEWSEYYVATSTGKTNFGWRSDNDWKPFDGAIDEVAFYNKPLTQAQIIAHAQTSVRMSIKAEGANAVITWPAGTLQQADTVNGTFTNVENATSPFTTPASGAAKFYRVKL